MRWLLVALWILLWSVPAAAQERRGRVLLEDGRSFEGVVLHLDQERVQLDVDGRRMTFRVTHISKYEPLTPEVGEPVAESGESAPAGEGESVAPAPAPVADGTARQRAPQPAPAGETATASLARRSELLGRRLGVIQQRYPWIAPRGPLQWASIGLLVLLYVTLAMQLGARFANAENREASKAFAGAIVALVAALAQIAVVPFDAMTLPVLLVGNAVAWLILTRVLYGLGFFASCTMFFSAMLVCGMAFLVFEVVDYTLNSIGAPAT